MIREEVIAVINFAFAKVRRGAITLHEAEVIDHYGSDSDRREARRKDTDLRWQDVADALIEEHYSALSFLCPESFRYYIPAYMVWTLRHYDKSSSLSVDFTIYALTPNTNKELDRLKLERFALFSSTQVQAVEKFLRFIIEHGETHVDVGQAELGLLYWEHPDR